MRTSDQERIERYRSGTDSATPATTDEPIEVLPEIQISRSLRLPREVFDALTKRAEGAGLPWSTLVKQWIMEKLTTDIEQPDPDVEIAHGLAMITHGVTRLRAERRAA